MAIARCDVEGFLHGPRVARGLAVEPGRLFLCQVALAEPHAIEDLAGAFRRVVLKLGEESGGSEGMCRGCHGCAPKACCPFGEQAQGVESCGYQAIPAYRVARASMMVPE